jgi:hypothetical protein
MSVPENTVSVRQILLEDPSGNVIEFFQPAAR